MSQLPQPLRCHKLTADNCLTIPTCFLIPACRDAAPQRLGAAAAALTLSVALLGGEMTMPQPAPAAPVISKAGATDEQAKLEELLAGEFAAYGRLIKRCHFRSL